MTLAGNVCVRACTRARGRVRRFPILVMQQGGAHERAASQTALAARVQPPSVRCACAYTRRDHACVRARARRAPAPFELLQFLLPPPWHAGARVRAPDRKLD
eukprot:COSAG02_NODE_2399_length_8948_cov_21.873771_4_plen_102_part_00